MKSKDFLRSKGILSNDSHHFIIDFHDGREINLGDLLEEYAQQSQPSPAGAAEGASEGISKIREVMNWISQCVDEDHDLEVSEIKMIWNDLSDAISLIESTPHSSEGMAEAWVIEYDNDTGSGDEYFVEWFNVTNGEKSFRCNSKEDAEFLLASLSPGVEDGSGWVKIDKDKLQRLYLIAIFDSYSKCDAFDLKFLSDMEDEVFPTPPGVEDNQTKC